MKERAQEQKATARRGRAGKADGEQDVLAKIAEMPEPDRTMATRLHAIIKASAPALSPKTWYGMPAYALDGKVVCFFQSGHKFKTRYATLGLQREGEPRRRRDVADCVRVEGADRRRGGADRRAREEGRRMRLSRALAIVDAVVSAAPGPVSVFVADDHGELIAAATMDGAAPDTRLNAQRKAYTAARSDARTTRELAEKVADDAVERASFDPFFTFFLGGVAVFDGDVRVGAVGVSGLPGEVDEKLALQAIDRSADR